VAEIFHARIYDTKLIIWPTC